MMMMPEVEQACVCVCVCVCVKGFFSCLACEKRVGERRGGEDRKSGG
jgi:hypothetical protein